MSQKPVQHLEAKMPTGEAHGRPPDSVVPQTRGSIIWEQSVNWKAHIRATQEQRPVPDEGACVHRVGVTTIDLDACPGSTLLLEGEQNINLPSTESEQHAALSIPTSFHFTFSTKHPRARPVI